MSQDPNFSKIFINPSGFIELHYAGDLKNEVILESFKTLNKQTKAFAKQDKPVLLLVDVRNIAKYDFLSPEMLEIRKGASKAMKDIKFDRAAIFGPLHIQVVVSTLALIANKRKKVRVFDNRITAMKWLLE